MRHRREDVVRQALTVLDTWGLPDLTMRRLARELGVQPSALYHHVSDKQTLLGLVADEILARGRSLRSSGQRPAACDGAWEDLVAAECAGLRESVLACRDGAEVVSTARAFGLGAQEPELRLRALLTDIGLDEALVGTAARTLVHFVLAHAADEQTHLQADGAGALPASPGPAPDSDFAAGLALVLDGIGARLRWGQQHPAARRGR